MCDGPMFGRFDGEAYPYADVYMGTCGPALPHTPPTFLILFCLSLCSQRAGLRRARRIHWSYTIIMMHAEIDRTFNDTA